MKITASLILPPPAVPPVFYQCHRFQVVQHGWSHYHPIHLPSHWYPSITNDSMIDTLHHLFSTPSIFSTHCFRLLEHFHLHQLCCTMHIYIPLSVCIPLSVQIITLHVVHCPTSYTTPHPLYLALSLTELLSTIIIALSYLLPKLHTVLFIHHPPFDLFLCIHT